MDMMMDDERPAVIKHYEPTYIMKPTEDKKCVVWVPRPGGVAWRALHGCLGLCTHRRGRRRS